MSGSTICRDPALHDLHFCKLKKKGLYDELAARSRAPAFVCHNCGARADREDDVCNASPLPK
ncbi:MAG: hypothetical protein FDZ69_06640 [Deltaproteobacteria bacterium]|nr:MAG: hypothetical protein FDZ69_06640 [Deltaproteobacteria bacterium]